MKNYWKRFAAWVIGLRNDPFIWARIQLTGLYTISILVVFLIANVDAFRYWINSQVGHENTISVFLLLTLIVISVSFMFSDRSLSPLRRIMRAQKRFIADASHELRTPLAIMKTNSEIVLLDGDHINPSEAQDTFKSNLEEIDRMSKIIENLLALSYYDNRFADIPFQEINLSKLVTSIVEKSQSLAKKKSINLRLLNTDPGLIRGNVVAIEQLAINLIKNAINYTPDGGQVSVSVTTKSTTIEFKVKDSGIGIEKKDLPSVFNPFYKAGQGRIQLERESSGLGLTIVKKIVERHDGSIYLNSAIGKGTTFISTFPRFQAENLKNRK
jgi:signal transduction histidine kinase